MLRVSVGKNAKECKDAERERKRSRHLNPLRYLFELGDSRLFLFFGHSSLWGWCVCHTNFRPSRVSNGSTLVISGSLVAMRRA